MYYKDTNKLFVEYISTYIYIYILFVINYIETYSLIAMDSKANENDQRTKKSPLEIIKEQREALKSFYHLKDNNKTENDNAGEIQDAENTENNPDTTHHVSMIHKNSSSYSLGGIDPSSIKDMDEFISTESYTDILQVENKVLDKLNSAKSEIKSTIYNNYYELIKINNVLGDLLKPSDSDVYPDSITDNLNTIRDNMQKIESLNIDIFDDVSSSTK